MGVLQLLDADETTVLFDFHDPTGATNPGTVDEARRRHPHRAGATRSRLGNDDAANTRKSQTRGNERPSYSSGRLLTAVRARPTLSEATGFLVGGGVMKRRVASVVLAVLLGVGSLGVFPAAAATKYANCTALHRHYYRYGVARSAAAAQRQVNTGHYKPRVSRAVYRANSNLDADKDGTACEVSR